MIFKIGNDIIETERIKTLFYKYPNRFKNRVFTNNEIDYCESKGNNKYLCYAARFAAKEAVFKAVSSKINNKFDISWKDIEILNDENGRPYTKLKNMDFVESIDISLSHVKDYAIATALVVI